MTDVNVEILNKQINDLKTQVSQLQGALKGMQAQSDATKQMNNELLASTLQVRAMNIMFQDNIKELNQQLQEKQKSIESLNQQLTDATDRIASLESKPAAQE